MHDVCKRLQARVRRVLLRTHSGDATLHVIDRVHDRFLSENLDCLDLIKLHSIDRNLYYARISYSRYDSSNREPNQDELGIGFSICNA